VSSNRPLSTFHKHSKQCRAAIRGLNSESCRRLSGGVLVFALLLPIAACNKKLNASPTPRYAVLRFENLSGDPALDWTGRAIAGSLPFSLAGVLDGPVLGQPALERLAPSLGPRPAPVPGISSERTEALVAGANRVITGYIERTAGEVRISATEEDVTTGKSLRLVTAAGVSPMAAMEQLAHQFSPRARRPPTSNPEAMRAWAIALESPPAQSVDLLERAVSLDPDFGAAWVALTGLDMVRGDPAAAQDVIEQARRHPLDSLSQANLELAAANIRKDRPGGIAAMRKISSLSPGDAVLLRSLAQEETAAGQFAAAASEWKQVTAWFPNDSLAWNSLGYAHSYAGDYAGALAALREYQQLRPKDANPSDSIGDLNYSFRRFGEAAASYLDANAKQPGFEQYADLYKAAWAKFRAGDKTGADQLFSRFRTERAKSSAAILELLAADWLYRTGREAEGLGALRKFVSETGSAPLRADAYAQLTIWDLVQGDRAMAIKDAAPIGTTISSAPLFMARFAALPSAPAEEWEMRAERIIPPSMGGLRRLALGYALLLDGKRAAALPVWGQIVNANPATDFFARAIYARLQGTAPERPLLPDPGSLNQFQSILDKL
jgi:tetratricopeptide (TPR) repeat protein